MDRSGRRPNTKRQTRLSFAPHGSSSPGVAGSPPDTRDRRAGVRYERPFMKYHGRSVALGGVSSETRGGAPTLLPTPENSSQVHQDRGEDTFHENRKDIYDGEAQVSSLSSPCPVPARAANTQVIISSDDEEDIRGQRPNQRILKTAISKDGESSSDPATPSRSKRPRKNRGDVTKSDAADTSGSKSGRTSRAKAISVEIVTRPKRSNSRGLQRAQRQSPLKSQISSPLKRRLSITSSIEIADGDDEDDEEEELVRPSTSRRLTRNKPMVELDSSEESEEDVVTSSPMKRRKRNTEYKEPHTPNKRSEQDKLDLAEDLEDIQDSVTTKTRTRGRLADSAKDKRQKHLDILRRRRAGEKPREDASSSEKESENSSSSGDDDGGEEDEDETLGYHYINSDEDENSDIEPGVPPNEDLDRYEDDFVLQDDEEQLGVPTGLEDMPLEFTRHRYKQPREYFRDVVEWMVHNKLNPEFNREDNVYRLAFMRLNDETKGRVGSHYVSSAWNIHFKRALEARPEMVTLPFPPSEFRNCDACNRSKHPASFDIQFRGDPYYLETLDPVSEDEEDSDDEGSGTRDREGHTIPESTVHFYLGRHCKSNATMAHTLTHWRHNLNGWIIDYLIREDITTKKKMRKRKRWSQERKIEYVNEVVGMMEERGEIDSLWRDFHLNLKSAREDKEFHW